MKRFLSLVLAALVALSAACLGLAESSAEGGYVLMNIPYADFYAAEVTDASIVDAVTSSTLMKTRTAVLAGGSYHVDPEGTDITGVIYPVYVEDLSILSTLGGVEITDDSSVEITVTNRGEESTTVYSGSDALFEAPSYSWYALSDAPQVYKTLSADGTFSAVNASAEIVDGSAAYIYERHADMVIAVSGLAEVLADTNVSGATLVAEDGTVVGLTHINNLWVKTEIGFNLDSAVYEALKLKRIQEIRFYTVQGVYAVKTDLLVAYDGLMEKLNGTYIELFPEFAKEEYKETWIEAISAYTDDAETQEAYYTMLLGACMGTLMGEEAIAAYTENPENTAFDCYFIHDLAKLTINGDEFSGVDADGNELFRNTYAYAESLPIVYMDQEMGVWLRIYKAETADAGDFTYFAFTDDTTKDTQHIEFRYGASLDGINVYDEGEYAYWLAGAIVDGYKDSLIQTCIQLFVNDNLGGAE